MLALVLVRAVPPAPSQGPVVALALNAVREHSPVEVRVFRAMLVRLVVPVPQDALR